MRTRLPELGLLYGGFSRYSLQVLAAVVPPLLWAFRCYRGRIRVRKYCDKSVNILSGQPGP